MPRKKKKKCFVCKEEITGRKYKSRFQTNHGRADEDLVPNNEAKYLFVLYFCSYDHMTEFSSAFIDFYKNFQSPNQTSMADFIQEEVHDK